MDHQIFNIGSTSSYTYAPTASPSRPHSASLTHNPSLTNIQQLNSNNQNLYADIQAQLELSVELRRFVNIDLFQRGYYQIRISLRLSNKQIPVKVVLQLENEHTNKNLSEPSKLIFIYSVDLIKLKIKKISISIKDYKLMKK
ncbi:hypothetical protein BpHYR1_040917 [Brachionus plicatilis]|uniref:Uncharacterized protein n=1 Tax=Brachionus plicatilis TaxID=10195 RepID=A0A3M7SHA4_BRAPC|nr:hypothetical protein BpHYR1_040917 [Brachionus plicatilis]